MPGYSRLNGQPSPTGAGPSGGSIGFAPGTRGAAAARGGTGAGSSAQSVSSGGSGSSSSQGRRGPPPPRYAGSSAPFARSGHAATGASAGGSAGGSTMRHLARPSANQQQPGASPASASASIHSHGSDEKAGLLAHSQGMARAGGAAPSLGSSHGRTRSLSSAHSAASGSVAASRYAMGPSSYFSAANAPEPDDYLHSPDKKGDRNHGVSLGGCLNILTLLFLSLGLLMLFAGYPILSHFMAHSDFFQKLGLGIGGTNGTGQIPQLPIRPLIDLDTPANAQSWNSPDQGQYTLVFSDEFNDEGRTFWPGDDPYWEAVDIWYGATGDYEWYSPEAINTTNGHLVIAMTAQETHNLNFQSGMLQSWNKFCFQGGYIEFSILQPGGPATAGYWPAAWIMGNLGRPGYLGSTDGMWPYSYNECDTGILANQTWINGTGPEGATQSTAGFARHGKLSYLPGMRSPPCTCSGQDHPGPSNDVGRAAPEIDILEAQIQSVDGVQHSFASQSLQTAPFDLAYYWGNKTGQIKIYNEDITKINSYHGSVWQEAVSSVTQIADDNFASTGGRFIKFGVEWLPDWDKNGGGFTRWFIDGKPTWMVKGAALGPSQAMDIGQRLIPTEPMSIIMNLGMSHGFQTVNWDEGGVTFPALLEFDYVRLYQQGTPRISCDPPDHPTAAYIQRNLELYQNPNITQFPGTWPLNKLTAAAQGVSC